MQYAVLNIYSTVYEEIIPPPPNTQYEGNIEFFESDDEQIGGIDVNLPDKLIMIHNSVQKNPGLNVSGVQVGEYVEETLDSKQLVWAGGVD